MAGERIKLQVSERERRGSSESKRLRKTGLVPGVLYGKGKTPYAICVPERELRRALTGDSGLHTILDVVIEGKKTTHASILKDYQRDPIRGTVIHVDLQEVPLDQPIQATVVVELVGAEEAPGVREGGALSQVAREVNVEALPMEVPEHVELDVSGMAMGDSLRLSDLPPWEGVTFLDDPETVLATVTVPMREEEPAEAVAEGEEAEGEERPEGAAEGEGAEGSGEPGSAEG
jgi:large subunit ribosomal protein L25